MLRTNLSTRPFYNERAVHLLLAVVALVLVAVSAFNVTRALTLSREQASYGSRASRDEGRARELQQQAARIRASLNAQELAELERAATEANAILDRRAFSWTALFNRIESTIPNGVMLTAIAPNIDAGTVSFVVLGRDVAEIDRFMEALESTGTFAAMLLSEERATEDGMYQATLAGRYQPRGDGGDPPEAPPSDTAIDDEAGR